MGLEGSLARALAGQGIEPFHQFRKDVALLVHVAFLSFSSALRRSLKAALSAGFRSSIWSLSYRVNNQNLGAAGPVVEEHPQPAACALAPPWVGKSKFAQAPGCRDHFPGFRVRINIRCSAWNCPSSR